MRSAEESARSDRAHSDLEGMTEHSQHIKSIAKQAGADLAGIADLEGFRGKIPTVPVDLLAGYRFALSAAVRLDDVIVSAITDHPTLEYAELYRQMNKRLDGIAARVVERIEAEGAHAREVPAGAIRNVRTESHYETREQAVALEKCHALVKTFAARPGIGARICGVCVRACPWGKKKR